MPSTTSSSVSRVFASSTVMTPSLPTFCIAFAIISPISRSSLAEILPTWAISSLVETFFERFLISSTIASTAMSTPRLRSIGFIPAATALEPSRTIACASTVAVVVPSPASSLVLEATSLTICAPMFSNRSASSISLATVTPSLVMRVAVKFDFLGSHVCLLRSLSRFLLRGTTLDHAHDVGFLHDDEVLAIELDLGARPLAEQHAVAGLDVERMQGAVLAAGARADGDDLAFHRLFLGGVGDDDAARRLRILFDAADQDAVLQRSECHSESL